MSDHGLAQVCQDGDEMVAVCKCGVKRYVFVHNNDGSDAVADLNEHIAEYVHRSFLDPLTTLRAEVGWLLWCLDQGYSAAEDREIMTNWLLDDEATLHPSDLNLKADLLTMADEVLDLIDKRMEAGQ